MQPLDDMRSGAAQLILSSCLTMMCVAAVPASAQDDEPKAIEPSRPGVTRPADIQKPGVLQVEFGYDSLFKSNDFDSHQASPVALRLAAVSRLLLEADLEPVLSKVDRDSGARHTGAGDTRVGVQWVAVHDASSHIAFSTAYYAKLPTADAGKTLGTGRFDHRIVLLATRKLGETDVDINGAYLNVGRDDGGRDSGGFAAVSVSREFRNHFGYVAELSKQTTDDELPKGAYGMGAVTYKVNERTRLDAGARVGLTSDSPRFSIVGGMTVGAPLWR